jgi:hypothetical protein
MAFRFHRASIAKGEEDRNQKLRRLEVKKMRR